MEAMALISGPRKILRRRIILTRWHQVLWIGGNEGKDANLISAKRGLRCEVERHRERPKRKPTRQEQGGY